MEVTQFRDRGTAEDDPAFVKARTMLAAVEALREQKLPSPCALRLA